MRCTMRFRSPSPTVRMPPTSSSGSCTTSARASSGGLSGARARSATGYVSTSRPASAERRMGGWSWSGSSPPVRGGGRGRAGIEPADPGWVAASIDGLLGCTHRVRALGTIASTLCQVAAARFDGMVTLQRSRGVDAAAGQLIVREAGGLVSFIDCEEPLAARMDATPVSHLVAARTARRLEELGTSVAGRGDGAPPRADLVELAIESERRVTAYTGLEPSRPLPPPEGIGRREWIRTNIDGMRRLLDPVLERSTGRLGPLRPAVSLMISAAVTTEVSILLGYLAQRVLGQYELVLLDEGPDASPPRLLFVLPNLGQAMRSFGARDQEFMTWVALHEVTHAVQFTGVPWLHGHVSGLVRELLEKAELRIDTPHRPRIPSAAGVRRGGTALRHGALVTIFTNSAERETLDRVQAVMAVIEGHAEHVMDAVAPDLLPSLPQLRETLNRRRRTQSTLSRIIARVLGLEMKLRQYEQGKRFCDAIVSEAGSDALRRLFASPESLPTLEEIERPYMWGQRTRPPAIEPARTAATRQARP